MRSRALGALALMLSLLCVGCVGAREAAPRQVTFTPSEPLVWPKPPAQPRIRFLRSIAGPQDIGLRKSLLQTLGEAIFGRSEEWMVRPVGVAARDGVLYVADPGSQALYIFDLDQRSFQKVAKAGGQDLVSPIGVAVGAGVIYLSDSYLGQILVFDRGGRFLQAFGARELQRPTGLAFDPRSRRLYVADTSAHRIAIYNQEGTLEGSFGTRGKGNGEFNYPTHLWLAGKGLLYVVDALNYRVQIFDRDGRFVAKFGRHGDGSGDLASPKGVGVDAQGHIYVVDALFDAVQIFDHKGQLLLIFGERGIRPGQFWLPAGLSIDERGRIYVADSYNQRVQVFQFLGGQNED